MSPLRDYVSPNPIVGMAADDAEQAKQLAMAAKDPGEMGLALVLATVAIAEAVLATETKIDLIVDRIDQAIEADRR
jgi:hypothetical protein